MTSNEHATPLSTQQGLGEVPAVPHRLWLIRIAATSLGRQQAMR
jgi:hypothetical protein